MQLVGMLATNQESITVVFSTDINYNKIMA